MPRFPEINDRLAVRNKPARSPVMFQRWSNLLFLHWEINPTRIQSRLPEGLHVDLHEGKTYLGLVPFFMETIRPRFLPCVHDDQGRPGVWFFSLDCNQPIAVELARRFFHLPYEHARMNSDGSIYRCQRKNTPDTAEYHFSTSQDEQEARPGSLEFFLLERYLLFSQSSSGQLKYGQVHHKPYRFSKTSISNPDLAPARWNGFHFDEPPVSALTSTGVDVEIFSLQNAFTRTEKER